jgi:hypothetical protein
MRARQAGETAVLTEFRKQCWRLTALVRTGMLDRVIVIDTLWEIGIAHALVRALGEDRVEAIIAEAFADTVFRPMMSEVAA